MTVTSDGKHVYVASFENIAAVFSRSIPSADLKIVKTGSVGRNLTYVITITNSSTSAATTNVQIKVKLPPGTTLVSAEAIEGSCAGTTDIPCTCSTLAAGACSTATIMVKVASGAFGMLTNIASTTADMLDSVIRNNTYKVIMTGLFPTCQCGPGSTVRYPPADVLRPRASEDRTAAFGWRLVSRRPPRRSPECLCPIWTS